MSLPPHLQPQTYWEKRTAIAEEALHQMIAVVANYCLPPAAHEDLRDWARQWDEDLAELRDRHPPPAPAPQGAEP